MTPPATIGHGVTSNMDGAAGCASLVSLPAMMAPQPTPTGSKTNTNSVTAPTAPDAATNPEDDSTAKLAEMQVLLTTLKGPKNKKQRNRINKKVKELQNEVASAQQKLASTTDNAVAHDTLTVGYVHYYTYCPCLGLVETG